MYSGCTSSANWRMYFHIGAGRNASTNTVVMSSTSSTVALRKVKGTDAALAPPRYDWGGMVEALEGRISRRDIERSRIGRTAFKELMFTVRDLPGCAISRRYVAAGEDLEP